MTNQQGFVRVDQHTDFCRKLKHNTITDYLCPQFLGFDMRFIHPPAIIRILSTNLLIEVFVFLICVPVALVYHESTLPFIWPAIITLSFSAAFFLLSRKSSVRKINIREGFLSVALSWVIFSLFGTLPYIFSRTIPRFTDALFESTSGITTTGSTVIANVEALPYSVNFYRALTHWAGGLGIVLLVIIILPELGISAHQLLRRESSIREKIVPKTKSVGFRLLFIYLALTALQIILLSAGDMNLFESICHSFSTIATGGFSVKNTSMMGYSPYSQYIMAIFMLFGGISFVIYYHFIKLQFKKIGSNDEFWFYLAVILLSGTVATLILYGTTSDPLELSFRQAFFQTISIITTSGFTTTDYLNWPHAGTFLIFILLFSGASTGSTTGGIKMARHLILIKSIRNVFIRLTHPSAVTQIKLHGNTLSEKSIISVFSFILIYIFLFISGTLLITLTGTDPLTSASAVAASLGNTGPGLGTIGPMFTYSHMTDFNKIFFCILMITGRLEVNTLFILLSRSFWKD